jgi:hypothetical protein
LTKVPHSLLARMFLNISQVKIQPDGSVFIDRNGKYFELVLDYLRNDCSLPEITDEYTQLMYERELDFWKLTAIHHPDFPKLEEIILSDPETKSDEAYDKWRKDGPFPLEDLVNEGKIKLALG